MCWLTGPWASILFGAHGDIIYTGIYAITSWARGSAHKLKLNLVCLVCCLPDTEFPGYFYCHVWFTQLCWLLEECLFLPGPQCSSGGAAVILHLVTGSADRCHQVVGECGSVLCTNPGCKCSLKLHQRGFRLGVREDWGRVVEISSTLSDSMRSDWLPRIKAGGRKVGSLCSTGWSKINGIFTHMYCCYCRSCWMSGNSPSGSILPPHPHGCDGCDGFGVDFLYLYTSPEGNVPLQDAHFLLCGFFLCVFWAQNQILLEEGASNGKLGPAQIRRT